MYMGMDRVSSGFLEEQEYEKSGTAAVIKRRLPALQCQLPSVEGVLPAVEGLLPAVRR